MEILPVAKCKWSTSTQCWKWLAPSIASRAVAKIWKWFYDRASLAHMFSLSFTHTFFPLTPSPRAGLPSSKANYRAPSRRAFVSPDFTGITCRTSITWRLNEPTTTLERERERERDLVRAVWERECAKTVRWSSIAITHYYARTSRREALSFKGAGFGLLAYTGECVGDLLKDTCLYVTVCLLLIRVVCSEAWLWWKTCMQAKLLPDDT